MLGILYRLPDQIDFISNKVERDVVSNKTIEFCFYDSLEQIIEQQDIPIMY